MPTYDYECLTCKRVIEVVHCMTYTGGELCPMCGTEMNKLISGGSGIIFKGEGFYETDYKQKENKEKRKREKRNKDDRK